MTPKRSEIVSRGALCDTHPSRTDARHAARRVIFDVYAFDGRARYARYDNPCTQDAGLFPHNHHDFDHSLQINNQL